MIAGSGFDISTSDLLRGTNSLSVQQLTAFTTVISAQKALYHQKPTYFARKLNISSEETMLPQRQPNNMRVRADLTISRGGFFYRAATLWNLLPADMKNMMEPVQFKKKLRDWVKRNIPIKP